MSAPPECGPDAVENAPETISPSPSSAVPIVQSESRRPATKPSSASVARAQAMLASASTRDREQEVAHHEVRVQVGQHRDRAERDLEERADGDACAQPAPEAVGERRETHQVTIAATIPHRAIARFENSITAWYCAGGTGPPWQSGQSGQPRPEPLSRTKAPDATFRYIATTSTNVSRANPVRSRGHDTRDASAQPRRDGDADCHRDSA